MAECWCSQWSAVELLWFDWSKVDWLRFHFNLAKFQQNWHLKLSFLTMCRYFTVLFGVSRSLGICSQVCFLLHSFSTSWSCYQILWDLLSSIFLGSVNMGPSSWVATREAEERDDAMAWGLLQESYLNL